MNYKYIEGLPVDTTRYFSELQHKFVNPIRVGAYVISFVLLGLHLAHGFQSAFQSMGFNNKYTKTVRALGKIYSIAIPLGFILVAVYHYFNH
jgi:succinate dehydrogenase / fumarate reductase cytochrome b subunit